MLSQSQDPQDYFRLKPIRVARVSEISETTAAAPVPKEERVNFHIGNPLQDARLSSAYLRIALGIDVHQEDLHDEQPDAILEYLGWETADKPDLEFLFRTIRNSSPYMPRGGFSQKSPHALIKAFCSWLEHQQEPLHYNTGEISGRREIILASGGIHETFRIILSALSSYLEITPARILCYRYNLLEQLQTIPNLLFENLADDEHLAREKIEHTLNLQPELPTFLLIGDQLGEETRRKLRTLSFERPLFFIEANNAPNHLSLAREAKLVQNVIRLLTPAIFAPRLHTLSTVFIAGNADMLNVIENVHFNLKGTPSASEVEFLIYLLEQKKSPLQPDLVTEIPQVKPSFEASALGTVAESALSQLSDYAEEHLERLLDEHTQIVAHTLKTLEGKTFRLERRIQNNWKAGIFDEFSATGTKELLKLLVQNAHKPSWGQTLQQSFCSEFIKHQPQYQLEDCLVASGSSRTVLSILGFHCGINEVVIPDLSWSYEQCFPINHPVPLTDSLELDVDAIIKKVEELRRDDPSWQKRGAVVINNPHNATGRIFDEQAIRKLIIYCLQQDLYVIDDLAYQNVAPIDDLPEIKTARQIASELVRLGVIYEEQADRLITIHSLSKTDSLAGARLAVVEIRDQQLRQKFETLNSNIQPNLAAIFICYLFYRSPTQATRTYWHLRNAIFQDRTQAILSAVENLPKDRNPFGLSILPPAGSMYPLLQIETLPAGLSLEWLASSLARRGIGLLPLATFARTEEGYETGRTSFRLTLGGVDGAEILMAKTRRLVIDLNRLIAEEQATYNRKQLQFQVRTSSSRSKELSNSWEIISKQILQRCENSRLLHQLKPPASLDIKYLQDEILHSYVPERLAVFHTRLLDRAFISDELMRKGLSDGGKWLAERLEREFMKNTLPRRKELFRFRSYDRTVHPTQMYSLQAEFALDAILSALISHQPVPPALIEEAAQELIREYHGQNVSITSQHEADEILLDLATLIAGEDYADLFTNTILTPCLSFWSDWDGSNRPSGQGHQLVAAVVMENVQRMAHILSLLHKADPNIPVNPELLSELSRLPQRNQRFTQLL